MRQDLGQGLAEEGPGAPALDPGGPRLGPRLSVSCVRGTEARSSPCHRHEPIAQSKTTDVGAGRSLGGRTGPQTPGMAANQASVCVPHPARQPEGEGVPRGSPFPRGPHAAPADRFRDVCSHQHSQASVGATEPGRDLISLAGHLAAPARSRPPACHWHLASNSSRPDPTSAAPVGRPRSRKPRVRQQIAHRGHVGHREAGAAFQFQEESRLAQRRPWPQPRGPNLGDPGGPQARKNRSSSCRPALPPDIRHTSRN